MNELAKVKDTQTGGGEIPNFPIEEAQAKMSKGDAWKGAHNGK